jgi:hypothetical protein
MGQTMFDVWWTEVTPIAPYTLGGYVVPFRHERDAYGTCFTPRTYTGLTPQSRVPVFVDHNTTCPSIGWAAWFRQDANGIYTVLNLMRQHPDAAAIMAAIEAGERWAVSPSTFVNGAIADAAGNMKIFHVAEISLTRNPGSRPALEQDIGNIAKTISLIVQAGMERAAPYGMPAEEVLTLLEMGRLMANPLSAFKSRLLLDTSGEADS